MNALKTLTRVLAFVGKEIVTTLRRPGALITLIVGPFLIMAVFGYGYSGFRRPFATIVVVPPGSELPRDPEFYGAVGGPPVRIVAVGDDADAARERLERQEVDLVVIAPGDVGSKFRAGKQEIITILYNEVDPITETYVHVVAEGFTGRVNREIIATAVAEGERYSVGLGAEDADLIPPKVVAAPTRAETENVAPTTPAVVDFFAPAVLALILQHMAVTLTALSLVRERLGGAMELFRIAPTSSSEILIGKYLAFGLLNGFVAAIVVGLMVNFFGVPLLANAVFVVAAIVLLSFASLGLGLLISAMADSERQAVQLSLLVLLASVFFSGFIVPLRDFDPAVRDLAQLLPVTHGIRLLQDGFLRGTWIPWHGAALIVIGSVLLILTDRVLARSMRPI